MKNFFDSKKLEAIGYGVSVKNYNGDVQNTVAFQELKEINIPDDHIAVDMVRSDSWKRPKLENLIKTCKRGDELVMLSIDTLLIGTNNKGIEYYKTILEKGIFLFVLDISGRVAKLSEFTTYYYEPFLCKWIAKTNHDELIEKLTAYKESINEVYRPRRINKKLSADFYTTDSIFKEIYFAYEAYQIDFETTVELFRNYCGINNVKTIRNIMCDYEKLVIYQKDFSERSKLHKDILELPKRIGGIPEEYYILKSAIEEFVEQYPDIASRKSKAEIFDLVNSILSYFISYEIYHRWELLEMNKPKPRIPIGRTFDVEKFKKTHKVISDENTQPSAGAHSFAK